MHYQSRKIYCYILLCTCSEIHVQQLQFINLHVIFMMWMQLLWPCLNRGQNVLRQSVARFVVQSTISSKLVYKNSIRSVWPFLILRSQKQGRTYIETNNYGAIQLLDCEDRLLVFFLYLVKNLLIATWVNNLDTSKKMLKKNPTCTHYLPILLHVDIDKFWQYKIEFFKIINCW